jgi:predicted Zn-dependent protease with MMP-like domain
MVRVAREEFERLVAQAVESLPPAFLERLENVEIVVEDWPSPEELQEVGLNPGATLFGLYQGVPQNRRGTWYGNVLPDRVVIYRRPIEDVARTKADVRREVRITLMHEIGHYFGLHEDELTDAGYQ